MYVGLLLDSLLCLIYFSTTALPISDPNPLVGVWPRWAAMEHEKLTKETLG
jgi:hypothetical protein